MKKCYFLFAAITALWLLRIDAAESAVKPLSFVSEDIRPIRIWDHHPVPFAVPKDAGRKEQLIQRRDGKRRITQIAVPEIYPFFAAGKGPHPAVLVAPGGGYGYLSWDYEGIDICRWLQRNGFTAFLLKYRCPSRRTAACADAARAIRLIRSRAKEFKIDPQKVGAIGFSAGAHLCALISAPAREPYPASDAVDQLEFRPNFTALIYPAFLLKDVKTLALTKEFCVDKRTPPTLLIQTGDDPIKVENSIGWYQALHQAGVPCEMHIWAKGGHGYALWRKNLPVSNWDRIAIKWFRRCAKIK